MVDLSLKVLGLKELSSQLDALPLRVAQRILGKAVSAGARIVREEAIARAPVDTGALRSQIFTKRERSESAYEKTTIVGVKNGLARYGNTAANRRMNRAGKEYKVDGKTFYWKFLEFGTHKMKAHPFLRPAFDEKQWEAVRVIQESLEKNLDKAID